MNINFITALWFTFQLKFIRVIYSFTVSLVGGGGGGGWGGGWGGVNPRLPPPVYTLAKHLPITCKKSTSV